MPRMGDRVSFWYDGLQGKIDDQQWPRTQRPLMLGRVQGEESVLLEQAAGRVLAQAVHARLPVPNQPLSRLQGFGVRSEELAAASTSMPIRLDDEALHATGWAGDPDFGDAPPPKTKKPFMMQRKALQPMPYGADAMLHPLSAFFQGEDYRKKMQCRVDRPVPSGWDVIPKGNQLAAGSPLLQRGQRLGGLELGMLGSAGVSEVRVFKRPRIGVLSFHSLLCHPGHEAAGSCLPDGALALVSALLRRWGYEIQETRVIDVAGEHLRDTYRTQITAFRDQFDFSLILVGSYSGQLLSGGWDVFCSGGGFEVDPKTVVSEFDGAFGYINVYSNHFKACDSFVIGRKRDEPMPSEAVVPSRFSAYINAGSVFSVTCAMYLQVRAVLDALSGVGAYSFCGWQKDAYKENGYDWRILGSEYLPRQKQKTLESEPLPHALKTILEGSSKERWRHHGTRWFTGVLLNPAPRDPERHWLQLAQLESQDDGRMGVRVLPTEEYQVRHLNEAEAICMIDKASSPEETEFPPGTVVHYFLLD